MRVVAPASPANPLLYFRGLAQLSQRYRVQWQRWHCHIRSSYLANSDQHRASELQAALDDDSVDALLAARGGYGSLRICEQVDFSALRRRPKWLIGFSDITSLHLEAFSAGVCSLHGPNLCDLGYGQASARRRWLAGVEHPLPWRSQTPLHLAIPGRPSEGILAGGNLALIHAHATSGRLRFVSRTLLFLEEVGEAPYRIDRMLTALRLGGHLDCVVGVVLGELQGPGRQQHTASMAAALGALAPLGVPVLRGLAVGHGPHNQCIPLGFPASLSTSPAGLTVHRP